MSMDTFSLFGNFNWNNKEKFNKLLGGRNLTIDEIIEIYKIVLDEKVKEKEEEIKELENQIKILNFELDKYSNEIESIKQIVNNNNNNSTSKIDFPVNVFKNMLNWLSKYRGISYTQDFEDGKCDEKFIIDLNIISKNIPIPRIYFDGAYLNIEYRYLTDIEIEKLKNFESIYYINQGSYIPNIYYFNVLICSANNKN